MYKSRHKKPYQRLLCPFFLFRLYFFAVFFSPRPPKSSLSSVSGRKQTVFGAKSKRAGNTKVKNAGLGSHSGIAADITRIMETGLYVSRGRR